MYNKTYTYILCLIAVSILSLSAVLAFEQASGQCISMRIAIICSSFFPVIDGVTIAVLNRLKQLSILGHQTIVFCPDYGPIKHIYPNYQTYTGEILPDVTIVNLPSTQSLALDFERDVTINSYKIMLIELEQFQPDIIHVDEAERLGVCWLKLPGVKYARQHSIPCIAWFHTNYLEYLDDYLRLPFGSNELIKKILGRIFAKIYNAYDHTLVSSSITQQKLAKLGVNNTLYADLLGYDIDLFQKSRDEKWLTRLAQKYKLSQLDNKIKLLFLGRLTPDKGWKFTLSSLAKLSPHVIEQIVIIVAGDGNLRSEIEQSLQELTPFTCLIGRVPPEDIPRLLMNSDIFVTNSEKETRGLTLIEAAAAGIPAIAPRAGGVIETIQDRETGFLYESQNQADFIEKLSFLITDADLRLTMGAKAKKVAQRWTWQKTVNNLLEIWQNKLV